MSACDDSVEPQELSSLERSGAIAFVCRDAESGEGRPLDACPDRADDGESRHLIALVTQTQRGEVALVDFTAGEVIDTDPTIPGPSFLPVGAQPVDIVSTPGGAATFVAVAESGKEGIFALPTVCLEAPRKDEAIRDVTSWPACALPGVPGRLALLVADGDVAGAENACDGTPIPEPREQACTADLGSEQGDQPEGRRKLAVTLPELGALAILDAQTILNGASGAFEPCAIESWIELSPRWQTESIEQSLPAEWQRTGVGQPLFGGESSSQCEPQSVTVYTEPLEPVVATPAGMVVSGGKLYIADRTAPVIHVVDVAEPCSPFELEPLVAVSYDHPGRVVTTREVAVSPTTSNGSRFLYAVDESDGSLITYELGPGAESRAPRLRRHAPLIPNEPPDRLVLRSPIRGLSVFERDVPVSDPDSGVAILSTACDPDPNAGAPGSLYRTATNYSEGARPAKLRGVFVAAVLANGDVAFVDVEDLDSDCRRPVSANHDEALDLLGCAADDPDITEFLDSSGMRTVSNELSCSVVVPNELRSGAFFANNGDVGIRAPSLRYFPRLSDRDGYLKSSGDDVERARPRILGVPFAASGTAVTSTVYVGSTLYSTDLPNDDPLILSPGSAAENSVLLPMVEPRAFASTERFAATFEGALATSSTTGQLEVDAGRFVDTNADYCEMGVQDPGAALTWATELGVEESGREEFAQTHADYVQIAAELDDDDPYWSGSRGRACASGFGFRGCEALFGTLDEPLRTRELAILEAYRDHLVVTPRWSSESLSPDQQLEVLSCCFPSVTQYVVRGAKQWVVRGSVRGFQHRITAGAEGRCEPSCDPTRARNGSRVIEITTSAPCSNDDEISCLIGAATSEDLACVTEADGDDISLAQGTLPAPCIHDSPAARFAIYRGRFPTVRDMSFSWEVTGGFRMLRSNIASNDSGTSVLPQRIVHLSQSDRLVVVDGSAAGLSLLSLTSLSLYPSEPYQ